MSRASQDLSPASSTRSTLEALTATVVSNGVNGIRAGSNGPQSGITSSALETQATAVRNLLAASENITVITTTSVSPPTTTVLDNGSTLPPEATTPRILDTSTSSGTPMMAAMIGGIVGGVIFLLLVALLFYYLYRRRRNHAVAFKQHPDPSSGPTAVRSPMFDYIAVVSQLNFTYVAIAISVLNAVVQVELQTVLLVMVTNAYRDRCIEDVLSLQSSDLVWETAPIIPLHIIALSMQTLKHSSTSFVSFLLILFGLSFASGVTQLAHIITECGARVCGTCSATTGIIPVAISRACLSFFALVILTLWTIHREPSLIKESATKASLITIVFLVLGTVAIVAGGRQGTASPFFYLWLGFTIFSFVVAIGISLSRDFLHRNELVTNAEDLPTRRNPHSGVNIPVSQTLPSSTNTTPLGQNNSMAHFGGLFASSYSMGPSAGLGARSSILSASRRRSNSGGAQTVQSSIGTQTLHAAVHPRLSTRNASTIEPISEPEVGRSPRRHELAYTMSSAGPASSTGNDSQPIPLFASRYPALPPSDGAHGTHLIPSHGAMENPFGDIDQSFPSPRPHLSTTAPSRSSSVSTSTLAVPPYTYGPYSHRPIRSNTLTSNGTYDTLPSYHSRQS
ncbi:hypothetical protein L218DRAFT_381548 [Marasmius fiardii PR-910]|nr:hypothetical protein L218DRAFT_381548 [Marasmius fiardii PR-910]